MTDYRCSVCDRSLERLDEVCKCGNALGVVDWSQ